MNEIKTLRERRYRTATGSTREAVEFKQQIPNAANDRVPDAVWNALQAAGVDAVERMRDMLAPASFAAMKDADRLKLLSLALDRAYGKADAGIKRSVKVTLSADGADAVAASLARLDAAASLPEYRGTAARAAPADAPTGAKGSE